jgi:hypothetical protein
MASDYRVSIAITLENGVSAVLALLTREMKAFQGTVDGVGESLKRWGAIAADIGLGAVLKDSVDHALDLQTELAKLRDQGLSMADVNKELAVAWKVSQDILTVDPATAVGHLGELTYALGSTEAANQHIEEVERVNQGLNAANVKYGHPEKQDEVWSLVKAVEERGELDPTHFSAMLEGMLKADEASKGKVTPEMFQSTIKYARTAGMTLSDEFVTQVLPRLMQSWSSAGGGGGGGGGPGNALMSMFAKVVQGQMPAKAAEEFRAMGLVDSSVPDTAAGYTKVLGGEVKGRDEFMQNPYAWVQDYVMPALKEHGVTQRNDIIAVLSKLLPVRTASDLAAQLALFDALIEKDRALDKQALGSQDASQNNLASNPTTIMAAFTAQWNAMVTALGGSGVSPAMSAMKNMTDLFKDLASAANADPTGAKVVFEGLAALVAAIPAAMAGGALGALAGPGGVAIGAGIGAVVAALGTLVGLNWDSVKYGFDTLDSIVASVAAAGARFREAAVEAVPALGALGDAVNAIGKFFVDLKNLFAPELDHEKMPKYENPLAGLLAEIMKEIEALPSRLKADVESAFSSIGDKFVTEITVLPGAVANATSSAFHTIADDTVSAVSKIPSEVAGAIDSAFSAIARNITSAAGGLVDDLEKWLEKFNPLGKKTSYEKPDGEKGDKSLLQQADWKPEGRQQMAISIPVSLDVDGRRLAESVSESLAMLFTFPTTAPSAGAGMGYTPGDSGFSAT